MKTNLKVVLAATAFAIIGCKDNKKSNNTSANKTESAKPTIFTFDISQDNPIKNYSLTVKGDYSKECEENGKFNWDITAQSKEFSFNKNNITNCVLNIDSIEFKNKDNTSEVFKTDEKFILETVGKTSDRIYLKDKNGAIKYQINSINNGKNRLFKISNFSLANHPIQNSFLGDNEIYNRTEKGEKQIIEGLEVYAANKLNVTKDDNTRMIIYRGEFEFGVQSDYKIQRYDIVDSITESVISSHNAIDSSIVTIRASDLQVQAKLPQTYRKDQDPSMLFSEHRKSFKIKFYVSNKEGKSQSFIAQLN